MTDKSFWVKSFYKRYILQDLGIEWQGQSLHSSALGRNIPDDIEKRIKKVF